MPNSSKANAKRKRLATKKLNDRAMRSADKDQKDHRDEKLDQQVSYGHPGNLGSGTQIGSAKDEVSEENKEG